MKIYTNVKCPYCGTVNKVLVEAESLYVSPMVVACDVLEGGCDRDFVIKPQLSISTKTFIIQEDKSNGK